MAKLYDGKKATADSLKNEAARKRKTASEQESFGKAQIKRGVNTVEKDGRVYKELSPYPFGKERLEIAANKRRSAMVDEYQANKLTGAIRAKSPTKMPAPRKSVQTKKKTSPNLKTPAKNK